MTKTVSNTIRESYRTFEEAEKSRDRWIERGHNAYIDSRYAKIKKFVVVRSREKTSPQKRYRVVWNDKYTGRERVSQWYPQRSRAEANLRLKLANKRMYPNVHIESNPCRTQPQRRISR